MNSVDLKQKHLAQFEAALTAIRKSQEQLAIGPALVSWIRIALLPLCIWYGWRGHFVLMFWLSLVAASSDYADGWLARRIRKSSTPGKVLDMLADKLFLSVMLVFIARLGAVSPILALIPAWYHIIIVFGLLVVSWSIAIPVAAITTSERLTIILSYFLVVSTCGSLAFPFKSIFFKISGIASILTPIAAILGIVSYFRFSRRLIQRYMQ